MLQGNNNDKKSFRQFFFKYQQMIKAYLVKLFLRFFVMSPKVKGDTDHIFLKKITYLSCELLTLTFKEAIAF